jgi:tetratricopeptide (TPR) repeat protein
VCFSEAKEINQKEKEYFYNLGWSCSNLNKEEISIQFYDQALELDKKYIYAMLGKAYSLGSLEKFDEAHNMIDKLLKMDP